MSQIRPATIADSGVIARLNREDLGYDYPETLTKAKLARILQDPAFRVWVAELDGQVVGYVQAEDYDALYEPHMKNILGIAVRHAFHGQGIGRALLNQVEEWARATDAAAVRLVSRDTRTEAHAFYRHCGYTAEKTQLNFKKHLKS